MYYPTIKGPIVFCKGFCPGGRPCYKGPGHKGQHTCLNAFGMRYPLREQWPKTCCPVKETHEQADT